MGWRTDELYDHHYLDVECYPWFQSGRIASQKISSRRPVPSVGSGSVRWFGRMAKWPHQHKGRLESHGPSLPDWRQCGLWESGILSENWGVSFWKWFERSQKHSKAKILGGWWCDFWNIRKHMQNGGTQGLVRYLRREPFGFNVTDLFLLARTETPLGRF